MKGTKVTNGLILCDFDSIIWRTAHLSSFTAWVWLQFIWAIYLVDNVYVYDNDFGENGIGSQFWHPYPFAGLHSRLCRLYVWQRDCRRYFLYTSGRFCYYFYWTNQVLHRWWLILCSCSAGWPQGESVPYFPCLYWVGNVLVQILWRPAQPGRSGNIWQSSRICRVWLL